VVPIAGQPAAFHMPAFKAIKSSLYRQRNKNLPAGIPHTRQAIQLPQSYQETTTGLPFLRYSAANNYFLIFVSDRGLNR